MFGSNELFKLVFVKYLAHSSVVISSPVNKSDVPYRSYAVHEGGCLSFLHSTAFQLTFSILFGVMFSVYTFVNSSTHHQCCMLRASKSIGCYL